MGIQNHHEMKLLAFFICAANAQSFNDKLPESITDDGYCQSVQISATVAEQWNVDRMFVEISVSGWGVVRMLDSAERKARLINDWSRLKFKLKYFNNLIGEYVDISPVDNYDSDQYVDSIDVRNEVWRVLFKDAKSKELSEMGEQRNELRLQTWIAVDSYLAYDDLEKDIVMEVESPQLCDGGYESELVYEQCGGYTVNQYQQCTNGANTCQRATCECDMALARAIQTSNEFDSANLNYNSCSNGSSSGSSPGGCCKLGELYQFYNTGTHQCCTNGEVALSNQC